MSWPLGQQLLPRTATAACRPRAPPASHWPRCRHRRPAAATLGQRAFAGGRAAAHCCRHPRARRQWPAPCR
eukprot:5167194-Heterocapsa_arctica.AAC.1